MKIIPGGEYAYEYLVGCKTGYTDIARSCLVSSAEKDGMKLICVVMHDESPYQYQDTIALYEYGFSNFEKINVAETEEKYNIDNTGLFYSGNDIFGNSQPFLALNRDDFILLPRTASFDDTESDISYDTGDENQAAVISYTYRDVPVGSVRVSFSAGQDEKSLFDAEPEEAPQPAGPEPEKPVVFVNVVYIFIGVGCLGGAALVILLARMILRNYAFAGWKRRGRKERNGRKEWRRRNRRMYK